MYPLKVTFALKLKGKLYNIGGNGKRSRKMFCGGKWDKESLNNVTKRGKLTHKINLLGLVNVKLLVALARVISVRVIFMDDR